MTIRLVVVTISLAAALALTACGSTPPTQTPAPDREAVPAVTPQTGSSGQQGAGSGVIPRVEPPAAVSFDPIKNFSIYFDLDQYTVDDTQIPLVREHAKYIKSNPSQRVSVQGNTDERGSREYNLSLGQKRAEAVKKLLVTEGAKESQIEAVSLGEEKPKSPGRDEAAWKENRRSDITYPR